MCVCFVARSKFNLYACVARATGIEFIYIRDRVKFSCHGHTHTRDAYAYITNNACIDYFLFFNFLRVWKICFCIYLWSCYCIELMHAFTIFRWPNASCTHGFSDRNGIERASNGMAKPQWRRQRQTCGFIDGSSNEHINIKYIMEIE